MWKSGEKEDEEKSNLCLRVVSCKECKNSKDGYCYFCHYYIDIDSAYQPARASVSNLLSHLGHHFLRKEKRKIEKEKKTLKEINTDTENGEITE